MATSVADSNFLLLIVTTHYFDHSKVSQWQIDMDGDRCISLHFEHGCCSQSEQVSRTSIGRKFFFCSSNALEKIASFARVEMTAGSHLD